MSNVFPDPELITYCSQEYGRMVVSTARCWTCKRVMVDRPRRDSYPHYTFPSSMDINFDAQLKMAGWVAQSDQKAAGEWAICEECAASGKASFECALCGQTRTSDRKEERIGDPPEFLCRDCYETVPAKEWDDKVQQLQREHQYDTTG